MLIETKEKIADAAIVTGLVTSPGWSSWLSELNVALTSVTLLVGLILGLIKLRAAIEKAGLDD